MIGSEQVVIDRLRNAHNAAFITDALHILGNLVAGIHRVVSAVIEEIPHVVFLEDLKNALVIGIVHIGIFQLIAAGTERGGGGMQQERELKRILFAHVIKNVVKNAANAVCRTVNLGDARIVQRGADDAVCACVNYRGGTAGLTDDRRTN